MAVLEEDALAGLERESNCMVLDAKSHHAQNGIAIIVYRVCYGRHAIDRSSFRSATGINGGGRKDGLSGVIIGDVVDNTLD